VKPSSPIVAFLSPPHRTARPSDLIEEYRDICHQLTRLLHFLELNADAVRKILKKHDRRLLSDDLATGSYLTTRVSRNPDSHLRQLFWQNGLNAIVLSLKAAIQEMPAKCQMLQDGSGEFGKRRGMKKNRAFFTCRYKNPSLLSLLLVHLL